MSSENLVITEVEGKWVVAIKEKFDDECERSLIAVAKTREEALESAVVRLAEHSQVLEECIGKACETLMADPDLPCISEYQEVEGVTVEINGECLNKLDAICKGENAAWGWLFR